MSGGQDVTCDARMRHPQEFERDSGGVLRKSGDIGNFIPRIQFVGRAVSNKSAIRFLRFDH